MPSGAGFAAPGDKVTPSGYAKVEDMCRSLLGTAQDLVVFPGEAVVALEAAARGLSGPGVSALNLVTGPYGLGFSRWLCQGGASVTELTAPFGHAVTPAMVEAQLRQLGSVDVVSLVHAEAATGVCNDVAAIARLARDAGALVVVDAVASVGAEPVDIDGWGLDLVVLSAQKALAGPAGASMVVVSGPAWAKLAQLDALPRPSALSLLDWKEGWLDQGRCVLPAIPNHLEVLALGWAAERALTEGMAGVVGRHQAAARATRAALAPLGLTPWVPDEAQVASVATLVKSPDDDLRRFVDLAQAALPGAQAAPITLAPLPLSSQALRVNHTGASANLEAVLGAVEALAGAAGSIGLEPDQAKALAGAREVWG